MNRRQWERTAYPAELRITATGHVLPAKLVDLSERGMQVVVPVKLYPGNPVRAELPTPGAALVVTGTVCWTAADRTDGTAQTRAGIAFEALQPGAEKELRALASERPGTSVSLQLPGSDEPVRASAIRTSQGVRLSFALPFLREGTIITLQPSEADTEVARIVRTHVYAGSTGADARVELLVESCSETRKRRFVHYDALPASVSHAVEDTRPANDGGELPAVPKRRVLTNVGYGLSLAAAVWLVSRLGASGADQTETSPELAPSALISAQPRATDLRPILTDTLPEAAQPAPVAPAEAIAKAEPAPAVQPASDTTVETKPTVSVTRSPVVSSTKDTSEIFVPVTGSLAGISTKLWTDPPAVVVEIPRGQIALARRKYDLHGDGVVGLSVGRPGGVTQLRVYVNSILSQYEASAAPGGVSIRIKRDLRSP
ncbi:MAG TPA: PilZ domain-containing protein [Polyangiales bacterium]|nr:PilZ domain-containing protein [Polyangiales bacterium]